MTITKSATLLDVVLPGMIEASERRGQSELVNSTLLPFDMGGKRALFERMGFKFGEQAKGDPIFIHAELPTGWSKRSTDHAMWSEIVDERGVKRVGVFYKAAFYDRSANMSLCGRYQVEGDWSDGYRKAKSSTAKAIDLKTQTVIFEATGEPKKHDSGYEEPAVSVAQDLVYTWLKENRPGDSIEAWFVD
jgi:hypothetical protein